MNRPLIIIYLTVILDAVGIGLIFPILPALLKDVTHVGEIAPYVGVMFALYAAMQFLFSPILGVLSDRYGRRPVLLLSLAGAAIDYLFMAFAPFLWMLILGRAIAGITSANMAIATAYITDISAEEQRAQRFGLFHAMFGIGFIIGPVLGGLLGDYWVRAPFIAAAVLNGLNFALALFVLPESRKGDASARFDLKNLNPLRPLGWALQLADAAAADRDLLPPQFCRPDLRHGLGPLWAGRVPMERLYGGPVAGGLWRLPRRRSGAAPGAGDQAPRANAMR